MGGLDRSPRSAASFLRDGGAAMKKRKRKLTVGDVVHEKGKHKLRRR
jgi:hypothetical protein